MARYVNLNKEKNVVIRKAYDCDNSDHVFEHEYMVVIETDDGTLVTVPVLTEDYLNDYTADEYLKECEDENIRILMPHDCPARDRVIEENITEWVGIAGCVGDLTLVEAIASVVSLLTRNNMWKDEYAKYIDAEKIKKEWNE